jgi:hypothetical protein
MNTHDNSYFRTMVDKEKAGVGSGEMSLLSAEQFEKPNRYVYMSHNASHWHGFLLN